MIEEYGWSFVIVALTVYGTGFGVFLLALFYVWDKVFTKLLIHFKVYDAVVRVILDKSRKKKRKGAIK